MQGPEEAYILCPRGDQKIRLKCLIQLTKKKNI